MLELTDLTKRYADFAFGPVDLTVGQEVLAVLGPSGSGKTTLLSLVAGILDPDGGSISLDGRPLDGRSVEERRTGLVFQDGALFPHMTARENIAYAATDTDRIDELAGALEIDDVLGRKPPTLSGGEQQRVALARTLAADPDTLLLDEPLSSLDAPIRRRLREELHGLFASLDIPVVYVTHDQRTATALGDRLAIVRDGGLEQVGAPQSVLERPANRFVARFTGTENIYDGTVTADGVRVGDTEILTDTGGPVGAAATLCLHPARIELVGPTADGPGVLPGTVTHWLNEGTAYRVAVDIDAAIDPLTVSIAPATFDALGADSGESVGVRIPPAAPHLLR